MDTTLPSSASPARHSGQTHLKASRSAGRVRLDTILSTKLLESMSNRGASSRNTDRSNKGTEDSKVFRLLTIVLECSIQIRASPSLAIRADRAYLLSFWSTNLFLVPCSSVEMNLPKSSDTLTTNNFSHNKHQNHHNHLCKFHCNK